MADEAFGQWFEMSDVSTAVIGRPLTTRQAAVNRAHARLRFPVERAFARLKAWRIFRKARISPNRLTSITKAILTLERRR
ncbi:transposase family protein [Streptomyces sp. NPDC056503]|uniref:transposase family protein n=1 Tax=Streptomyces sp. NPDC056503 TaxID=3345842 RepID=UPI003679ABDB